MTEKYKYCPRCGAEYRPGVEQCADCSVKLVGAEEVKELKQALNERKAKRGRIFATASLCCMGISLLLIIIGNILFRISHQSHAVENLLAGLLATSLICSVILGFTAVFTLKKSSLRTALEVTIVLFFLVCVVIAIPNLWESNTAPGRAAAMSTLKQIYLAQKKHFEQHGSYATLRELHEAQLIDEYAASGNRSGYSWEINSFGSKNWSVVAWPDKPDETGSRSFYVDQTGIIRCSMCESKEDPLADADSEPLADFSKEPESW